MTKLTSNDICGPIQIDHLDQEGRGVGRIDGKVAFIEHGLPGERVNFRVVRDRSRFYEGKVENILIRSNERTVASCIHFGKCGGCRLQHLQANSQVHHKEQMLLQQLARLGKSSPGQVLAPLTGNPWGYRNRARLGVSYAKNKGRLLLGFRERAGNNIAAISECPVLRPEVGTKLVPLTECLSQLKARMYISQVEVAAGDNDIALVFRNLVALETADQDKLLRFGAEHQLRVFLQPGGPATAHAIDGGDSSLSYRLPEFDLTLRFSPTDFTQINTLINRQMVERAVNLLHPTSHDKVLDLFSGIGNFGLALARSGAQVIGVEWGAELVNRAKENAVANNLPNAHFLVADLTSTKQGESWFSQHYGKVLLDPPRSGASEIVPMMSACGAERVVYVSCNPATLARDTALLTGKPGFKLTAAGVMDMFPHTAHIESIALFER